MITGDMLKGHLDLLILAALGSGPAHGYAIIEAIASRSGGAFDLPEGTVYPALHRLETQRLLTSTWTSENGRRRRVYQLTKRGASAFAERQALWERFSAAVGALLGGVSHAHT